MLSVARRALPGGARAAIRMTAQRDGPPANELQCTVALVKNIVGTGVLTLPAGIARLSDGRLDGLPLAGAAEDGGQLLSTELTTGVALIIGFAVLNAAGFLLVGQACAETDQGSYVGAWSP